MKHLRTTKYATTAAIACLFVVAAGSLVSCGAETPCDSALDKVESCGIDDLHLTPAGEECAAYAACTATCLEKAGCNDIKESVQGSSGAIDGQCSTGNELDQCFCNCGS